MNKTCAIVVTFNRLELLKECLQAITNQTSCVSHVVVVNNASTDGTLEFLETQKKDLSNLIVLNSEKNMGGAGGFEKGLQIAYEQTKDDFFWVMDDDTIVDSKANCKFLNHASELENKFGFLISNVRWTDGSSTNVMSTNVEGWPDEANRGLIKVDYGTFVSFFVSRKSVAEFGYPIAEFFIWGDDAEYSLRVSANFPGYFMCDVLAIHKSKTKDIAIGVENDSPERINRYYYYYRNHMYIWKTYFSKKYKTVLLKKIIAGLLIPFKSKNHRFIRTYITFKGIFASFTFKPDIRGKNYLSHK